MKRRLLVACAFFYATSTACADMPLLLREQEFENDEAQWKTATPVIQSALECTQILNPKDKNVVAVMKLSPAGQWISKAPNGFLVFGIPVTSIEIYIDPDKEMGASYTTELQATTAQVSALPGLKAKNRVGDFSVEPGSQNNTTKLTCTVRGTWES